MYLSAGERQCKVMLGGRWLSWSGCDRALVTQRCVEVRRPFQEAAFEIMLLHKFVLCLFFNCCCTRRKTPEKKISIKSPWEEDHLGGLLLSSILEVVETSRMYY